MNKKRKKKKNRLLKKISYFRFVEVTVDYKI